MEFDINSLIAELRVVPHPVLFLMYFKFKKGSGD